MPKVRLKHSLLSESMEATSKPPKEPENQPERLTRVRSGKTEHQKEQKLQHNTELSSTDTFKEDGWPL